MEAPPAGLVRLDSTGIVAHTGDVELPKQSAAAAEVEGPLEDRLGPEVPLIPGDFTEHLSWSSSSNWQGSETRGLGRVAVSVEEVSDTEEDEMANHRGGYGVPLDILDPSAASLDDPNDNEYDIDFELGDMNEDGLYMYERLAETFERDLLDFGTLR